MEPDGGVKRGADWAAPMRQALAQSASGTAAWMTDHTRLLKSDIHSRVGLLELENQPCFLKLYLAKSPLQQMGFRLGFGRAMRSFDAANALRRNDLPAPAPRTCLLVPEGILLLTEGIPDSLNLRELWRAGQTGERASLLMRSTGSLLATLHRAGFSHGDCKWSNLLWSGEHCYLVDLEAVRKSGGASAKARPPARRQFRDLARFTVDAEELGASQAQYDVFLESYCAGMDCPRAVVAGGINSAATPVRRRHAAKRNNAPRLLV